MGAGFFGVSVFCVQLPEGLDCKGFIERSIKEIKSLIGDGRAISGLSGELTHLSLPGWFRKL